MMQNPGEKWSYRSQNARAHFQHAQRARMTKIEFEAMGQKTPNTVFPQLHVGTKLMVPGGVTKIGAR